MINATSVTGAALPASQLAVRAADLAPGASSVVKTCRYGSGTADGVTDGVGVAVLVALGDAPGLSDGAAELDAEAAAGEGWAVPVGDGDRSTY